MNNLINFQIFISKNKKILKLMSYKPILIVAGQPNSIFLEIFFKSIKKKKFKSPLILICSKKLLMENMKKI